MSESLTLYRVQNLDSKIDQIESRLETIEHILMDNEEIERARKKLGKAEANAKEIRIEMHQIMDKVEAQRIKLKTTQAALFGGRIKNPKELEDLQMESEALKRYIAQLEDEQLEMMIANEEAENAETQARKNLEQVKGKTIEQNAALVGERSKLESDLERLSREKEAVLPAIPPRSLQLYKQLRETRRGIAVATVTDGGCSICGQALTPADLQSIRASNKLIFCPSCGRILYGG
jgi:predicted  nucleic acid-binding Zn-ribbon protein